MIERIDKNVIKIILEAEPLKNDGTISAKEVKEYILSKGIELQDVEERSGSTDYCGAYDILLKKKTDAIEILSWEGMVIVS